MCLSFQTTTDNVDPEETNQRKTSLLDTMGYDSHAMDELPRTDSPEQVTKKWKKKAKVLEEGHWLEESAAYSATIRTKASILWLVMIIVCGSTVSYFHICCERNGCESIGSIICDFGTSPHGCFDCAEESCNGLHMSGGELV